MSYKRKTLHRIRLKINGLGICEEPEECQSGKQILRGSQDIIYLFTDSAGTKSSADIII